MNKQPYQPRYTTINKSFIPEKEDNNDLKNRLFGLFSEGNFLKIKDFILTNKMLINVTDINDNTILHTIIENETLTENQKIELVKLCLIEIGGINVSATNKLNVTPLHLACQIQSLKMVELLLNYGANDKINHGDWNNKTALHYATIGKSIVCPTKKENKVGSIINNKKEKIDKLLLNLQNEINKVMTSNKNPASTIETDLKHIRVYLENYKNIYPQKHNDYIKSMNKIISTVITDTKISNEDKNKILLKKIISERDQLVKYMQEKLSHDSEINIEIKIEQNNDEYLSVSNDEFNKILKICNIDDKLIGIDKKKISLKNENNKKKNIIFEKIQKYLEELRENNNFIKYCAADMYSYMNNLSNISGYPLYDQHNEIHNLFTKSPQTIIFPDIEYDNTEYDFTQNASDINHPNGKINHKELLVPPKMPLNLNRIYILLDNIDKNVNGYFINDDQKYDYLKDIFGNDEYEKLLENFRIDPNNKPQFSTLVNNINVYINNNGGDQIIINNGAIYIFLELANFDFGTVDIDHLQNDNVYFFSILMFYEKILNFAWEKIDNIIKLIENNLINENYDEIFNINISKFIAYVIDFQVIMAGIDNINEDTIKSTFNKLFKISGSLGKFNNNAVKYLYKLIKNTKKEFEDNQDKIQSKSIKNYNDIILPLIEWINSIIEYIYHVSSQKILNKYHRDNQTDVNLDNIENIVNEQSYFKVIFPESAESFKNNYLYYDVVNSNQESMALTKRKLFENMMVKIPNKYNFILYKDLKGASNDNFIDGYIIKDPNDRENYAKGFNTIPPQINYYKFDKNVDNAVMKNNIMTHKFGQIGISQSVQIKKTDFKYPILFSIFGNIHIGILKYNIIKENLQYIYDILTNGSKSQIKVYVDKFEESIKKFKSDKNDYSAILVIIGNYMKSLLDKYILDLIIISANKMILNGIDQTNFPKFYKEISENLKKKSLIDNEILSQKNSGYKLNLGEIFIELFKNGKKIENFGNIIHGDIVEEPNNKFEGKIIKIFNNNYQEIKSYQETCYIIMPEIIELLLQYKANPNSKDNNGQTPLATAIITKNIPSINALLNNGASVSIKDKMGYNNFEIAFNKYKEALSNEYVNIYRICEKVYENTFDDFGKKNLNNLPFFSSIIFKVALHILNHHFLTLAQKYYGKWNYQSFENIKKLFSEKKIFFDSALPLLDIDLNDDDFGEFNVFNLKLKDLSKNIDSNKTEIDDLVLKLNNLNLEKNSIEKIPLKKRTDYQNSRLKNIDESIKEYTLSLNKLKNKNRDEKIFEKNIIDDVVKKYKSKKTSFDLNKLKLKTSNNVVSIYDSVFIDVVNNDKRKKLRKDIYTFDIDYVTYPNMWKKYLKSIEIHKKIDYTAFMEGLNLYQRYIFNKKDEEYNNPDRNLEVLDKKFKTLYPVLLFYSTVINPYVKDYMDLPKEYNNGNDCLDTIINIICHILKRFILISLYYEICANIEKYLEESFKEGDIIDQKKIKEFLAEILGDKNDISGGTKLTEYIFKIIPMKLIKKTLNIYEGDNDGEYDMDKNEITTENLIDDILNIIVSSTTIAITMDSPLINNLRIIFTRQKEYITLSINSLYLLMNNYMFFLYTQSNDITIVEMVRNCMVN